MGRSTQWIGLTQVAQEFVDGLESLPSDAEAQGMFEEIPLGRWKIHPCFLRSTEREGACIREVVQASPWSSGPMLFTCLEVDFGNGAKSQIFQWIDDPLLEGEFDQSTGRMWV